MEVNFLLLCEVSLEISSYTSLLSSLSSIRVLSLLIFSFVDFRFSSSWLLSISSIWWWFELLFSRSWANCKSEQWALIKNPVSNKYYNTIMSYNFSWFFPFLISILFVINLTSMIKIFTGLSDFLMEYSF